MPVQVLRNFQPPPIDFSDNAKALATLRHFVQLAEQADRSDQDVEEETLHAPSRDGFELPLKVFRAASKEATPEAKEQASPIIVLYFPGGFVLGNPTMMAPLARSLVKRFNAVVVAPTYRLAPEQPFPTGVNDGWDALAWIAEHARSTLRADPFQGFIVGGISAGGNITNTITHLARDRKLKPAITGNWLSCAGVRLAPKDAEKLPQKYRDRNLSRTQEECINATPVSRAVSALIDASNDKRDLNSELCSPMIWPSGAGESGHQGMPRTYSQVCGMDPVRDELLIYDDMLKNEGVETRVDLYVGLPHTFWGPFKDLPQSKEWEQDTLDGFAWLLKA